LSVAKAIAQIRRASDYGIDLPGGYQVDFKKVMERMRRLRTKISPADGHAGT
jgi:pyruvate/2-oxoglutarate dehydrogenase complex dihydrolipoamide dehydrogenase (E3) component